MADMPQVGGSEMGRKATVRVKNGYWFSEAGGIGRYFGRIDVVSSRRRWQGFGQPSPAMAGIGVWGWKTAVESLQTTKLCIPEAIVTPWLLVR